MSIMGKKLFAGHILQVDKLEPTCPLRSFQGLEFKVWGNPKPQTLNPKPFGVMMFFRGQSLEAGVEIHGDVRKTGTLPLRVQGPK